MPYAILFIFFFLQTTLLFIAGKQEELNTAYDIQAREDSIYQLASATNSYYLEIGTYPASFTALAATSGYEHLRNTSRPHQYLATATNIDDGVFKFNRISVFTQDPYGRPLTSANYLLAANNTCGTGTFAAGADWCGSETTQWWKHETRDNIQSELALERKRLRRVLEKFNAWYNGDASVSTISGIWGNNYPDPGAASAKLSTLVSGFTQTATTCTGIYTYSGIPIDCTDLYSIWGTPTVYNYLSSSRVALLTKSPYTKSDGTPLYVSTEVSL